MSKVVDSALEYLEMGMSVVPVGQDKRPLLRWEEFQKRRALPNEVKGWYQRWPDAGVAIITGQVSGVDVIDIDNSDKHDIEDSFEGIIPLLGEGFAAPTVYTPRGGVHLYCQHETGMTNRVEVTPGTDLRAEGGYVVAPPSVRSDGVQYRWDDVRKIGIVPVPPLPGPYLVRAREDSSSLSHFIDKEEAFTEGRRNNDLYHALYSMCGLIAEDELKAIAYQLGRSAKPPIPDGEIDTVLSSVLKRGKQKDVSLAQDVYDFVGTTNGFFSVEQINREFGFLGPFAKADRNNVSVILQRMMQKGVIEKYGERSGVYRRVVRNKEQIDWQNADANRLDLSLPLGLDSFVYHLPKSIIAVAGFPSAGKTALCFDIVKRNMFKWETIYMCSDLGKSEIKNRLSQHEDISVEEWEFEAVERSSDFSDIVAPNGLNIIDYIRLDETWRVGAILESIWQKLDQGVAVVCIQKEWGRVLGRGKEWSLEKPRLYISLDPGKARIIKAKNFLGIDPVGYSIHFDLENGWRFKPVGQWVYEPLTDADFVKPWQRRLF